MTENEAKFLEKLDELANDTEVDMYSVANLNFFFEESANTISKLIEEIQQYRAIGTIEDFKALKEKSVGKKIVYVSNMWIKTPHCPNCDMELTMNMYQRKFCDCGQKLDWQ